MSESKPKPWVDGPFELLSSDLTGHSVCLYFTDVTLTG